MSNPCPACGGELIHMGQLAGRVHSRCRDCGIDSSRRLTQWEEDRRADLLLELSRGELDPCDVDYLID